MFAADAATQAAERPGGSLGDTLQPYDTLRNIYLRRLERLLGLRQQHYHDLNEKGLRLLDHSIFAAYCDCREVGAGDEGRHALRQASIFTGSLSRWQGSASGQSCVGTESPPEA
jgi:hypothetical protein